MAPLFLLLSFARAAPRVVDDAGQLGTGSVGRAPGGPARVAGLEGVVAVSAGDFATCAVRRDGSAWCWGNNEAGLLVLDAAPTLPAPTRIAGIQGATTISLGQNHACVTDAGGAVWCWGNRGATGIPSPDPSSYVHGPERMSGLSARALSAGAGFTCVLTRAGSVVCPGLEAD